MAGVRGGLFSLDASGSIAKTLTFSKWKGRPYVRQLVKPSNPRSIAQRGVRATFGFCALNYAFLTVPQQDSWQFVANAKLITALNAWTSDAQLNRKQDKGIRLDTTGDFSSTPTPGTALAATAGFGRYTLDWSASVDAPAVAYFLYRSDTTGFTAGPSNMVGVVNAGSIQGAQLNFTESEVLAGTWYLLIRTCGDDGGLGVQSAEESVVVT